MNVIFDRIHTATGAIEDGFYAVGDSLAPGGWYVFRVKTQPDDAKEYAGQQVIARAHDPYSRNYHTSAVIADGQITRVRHFKKQQLEDAIVVAMNRLLTPDTREDAGMMYARQFGRCRSCGRKLTHPDSVATGIGPECAGTRKHEEDDMPMNRALYPKDWPSISASIRERAGNRCEWPGCGLANGEIIQGKRGPYHVVLTVAHLDHDPANCDPANLRAWCQPHHLRYDAQHHAKNAAATRRRRQVDAGQEAFRWEP